MKNVAVVDIDSTIVDSSHGWWMWLEDMTKAGIPCEVVSKWYNFSIPYKEIWEAKGISGEPFDYWRGANLYDNLTPIEGAVECMETLAEKGFKIAFVSVLKGNHHKSKHRFLERYFPMKDAFLGTKEKDYVFNSIVIDDRISQLNKFTDPETIKIQFDTPYNQDEELKVSLDYKSSSWEDIRNWIIDTV